MHRILSGGLGEDLFLLSVLFWGKFLTEVKAEMHAPCSVPFFCCFFFFIFIFVLMSAEKNSLFTKCNPKAIPS